MKYFRRNILGLMLVHYSAHSQANHIREDQL